MSFARRTVGPLALATYASITAHVGFLLWLSLIRPLPPGKQATRNLVESPVELETVPDERRLVEPHESVRRPNRLAESADSGNRKKPGKEAFLGERTQSVEQETRARHIGKFAPGGSKSEETQTARQRSSADGPKELAMSDLLAVDDEQSSPAAASDDALGNVAAGDLTLLNTREYRYFSFYRRMKDALRTVWRKEVEQRNAALVANGTLVATDEMVTALRVDLNADGTLKAVDVVYSSGISTFDEAALFAFRSVGRFPNPPSAMRDANGVVRLRWEFVIYGNQASAFRIARDNGKASGGRVF